MFYFSLVGTLLGAAGLALTGAAMPTPRDALYLAGVGLSATLAQLAMTRAYGRGGTLLPATLQYAIVPLSALLGTVEFAEPLPLASWIGIAVIVASSVLATWSPRHARQHRRRATRCARQNDGRTPIRESLMTRPSLRTLVNADHLRAHLFDHDWCVIDCRHDLLDFAEGWRLYQEGHIPGASSRTIEDDLAGPRPAAMAAIRCPIATSSSRTSASGESTTTRRSSAMTRKVVSSRCAFGGWRAGSGIERVAVLDGGWPAWLAASSGRQPNCRA